MATKEGINLIMGDLKREEIREGIAQAIPPLDCCYCVHFGYCTWDKKGLCEARYELADSISNYLDSQGVVIIKPWTTDNNGLTRAFDKIEPVPHVEEWHGVDTKKCPRCQVIQYMLAIDGEGMIAVEPLIKDDN